MKHGFLKAAAVTPKVRVADPVYNADQIIEEMRKADARGARLIVFPELCITAYTCQDLFLQELLLRGAMKQLLRIASETCEMEGIVFVGLPVEKENKLYNVAAALHKGQILGLIPKLHIPNYSEFYEGRYFTPGKEEVTGYSLPDEAGQVPFGTKILFEVDAIRGLRIGCEICEDLWVSEAPSLSHGKAGATVIVNLSASNELIGKASYRKLMVQSASARMAAGYLYAGAGCGESTQDVVFGGHNLIAENGVVLSESRRFTEGMILADLDIQRLTGERRRMNTFQGEGSDGYVIVPVSMKQSETKLERKFASLPFVPGEEAEKQRRCEEILTIQACGLSKRLEHTGCSTAVIGISGGLDSTLALLVAVKAFDRLSLDRSRILAVTMPCFGTTDRTYDNACKLAKSLGATLEEINIQKAVRVHFEDIGQPEDRHDVTYENAQARERTQVLMDIANRESGMVIGTGDLSELALGWATYNGDHMSMYGVNGGVPKTLIRHLVQYYAETCGQEALSVVLRDVLDTPVSPELLPPVDGEIAQKTEDLVGPYELHDFYLYYMLRFGFAPRKIYRLALAAFEGQYEETVIVKWLKVFYRRFFSQQFKRSCLPDGPKVGSVAVSPRGDLRMPSDAAVRLWMEELEELEEPKQQEEVQG